MELGYGRGCSMVWTSRQGHLSTLAAFAPKQLCQVQTMSDGKGLSPDLGKGTSNPWVLQQSGVHMGTVEDLPTPPWRRCSPHLPARSCFPPEQKELAGEATRLLFNP